MLTTLAATLLTLASVDPAAPSATSGAAAAVDSTQTSSTLAAVMPTPGAWTLMGMGGLALLRARRVKR